MARVWNPMQSTIPKIAKAAIEPFDISTGGVLHNALKDREVERFLSGYQLR